MRFERIDGKTYTEVAGSTYMGQIDEDPEHLQGLDYPTANACWWKVWHQTSYYSQTDWGLVPYFGVLAGRAMRSSDKYPPFEEEDPHARL